MTFLLISVGAAIGAPLRYLTDRAIQQRRRGLFPWGTLCVNLAASFILGVLLGAHHHVSAQITALVATGFCGALSTYSTFSYETLRLQQRGERRLAFANISVSVVAGIGAAASGWAIAAAIVG
jgi:fluoride exporter